MQNYLHISNICCIFAAESRYEKVLALEKCRYENVIDL